MMAVGVTALEPMTVDTQVGMPSPARQPLAIQIPRPKTTEVPTMVVVRCVRPSRVNMRTPFMVMVPKTPTVAPPMTGCGMAESTAESCGNRPAMAKTAAMITKTHLLTTLLEQMMPTFWPRALVGRPPSRPPTIEVRPWDTIAPESSRSVGIRSMEPRQAAETSPIT